MSTKTKNVALFTHVNEGFLQQIGPDGRYNRDRIADQLGLNINAKWSDAQRQQFQSAIENELGMTFPKGIEIDNGGHNLNENVVDKGTVAKRVGIGAAIGGAALTGLGAAGIGPLAGMLGGGAAAASGAGAAAASGAGTAAGTAATTAGVGGAIASAAKAAAPALGDTPTPWPTIAARGWRRPSRLIRKTSCGSGTTATVAMMPSGPTCRVSI